MTLAKLIAQFVKRFGRKPQGMEMIRLRQMVKKQPAEIIPFPKERITPWFDQSGEMSPRGQDIMKQGLAGLEQRAKKIEKANQKLKKMQDEKTSMFPGSKDKTLLKDSPERIKEIKAENKKAVERLKKKKKKTVEDFSDDGDFDPGGMAQGGLAPLVGQPTYAADFYDDRIPYQGGGLAGAPPVTSGIASQVPNQMQSMGQGPGALIQPLQQPQPWITGQQQQAMANAPPEGLAGMKQSQMAANPGPRTPMKQGGVSRRNFLKMMGGLGALPFVGKFFKLAKTAASGEKVAEAAVAFEKTAGMPSWFPALVNKIIKEGDDVTSKLATKEREIVHTKKLGDPKNVASDEVTVYQNLDTGDVRVEVDSVSNMGEAPIQLDYKAPSVIDEGKMAGKKTDPEFSAVESEPKYEMVSPDDAEVSWDNENIVGNVDDLMSDTTALKNYAEGTKPTMKDIVTRKRKMDEVDKINSSSEAQVDYSVNKYGEGPDYSDYDDIGEFAHGGLASLVGE